MKFKKYYLAIIVFGFFIVCFIIINTKYDEFYRIQGIDNESRILIEHYLSEEDQKILIENSYATKRFLPYITIEGFKMSNLEYYEMVKEANVYSANKQIVQQTNMAIDKLSQDVNAYQIDSYFKSLIQYNVIDGYNNSNEFDFTNIEYYHLIKQNSTEFNDNYVEVANFFLNKIETNTTIVKEDYSYYLQQIVNTYTRESIDEYMNNTELNSSTLLLFEITPLSTIKQNETILSFEPEDTQRVEDLPRMTYFTYLESETYQAYVSLYQAVKEEYPKKVLLLNLGLISYDKISDYDFYGVKEFQLGTSIEVFEQGFSSVNFEESELSSWLEENAYLYGFILRYSKDSDEYNPKIYRYVGIDVAKVMHDKNLTLEEYNQLISDSGGNDE